MLIVHATLVVQPDKRDEFVAAFAGLAETTNQEDGVLSYTLYESAATPSSFMVVEEYKDEDAFNAHMTSEHFQAALPLLSGVLAAPPKIVKHEAQEGVEVPVG
jgi:quinol monooxygenase YgiN